MYLAMDCIENTSSSGSSVVMCVSIAAGMCLLSYCIAVGISSGCAVLAFMHHVAICTPAEGGLFRPKLVGVLTTQEINQICLCRI
jgi:hypothetical protein